MLAVPIAAGMGAILIFKQGRSQDFGMGGAQTTNHTGEGPTKKSSFQSDSEFLIGGERNLGGD